MENITKKDEIKGKLIFRAQIAKALLEDYHHPIIGIKSNKSDPKLTVFIFEDSLQLRDDMQKIVKKRREAFEERRREREKEPLQQED